RYCVRHPTLVTCMPYANRKYRCINNDLRGRQPPAVPLLLSSLTLRSLGLAHAVFDIEPALVAGQTFGLHFLAAYLELRFISRPFGFHFLPLFHRLFHFRRLGVGSGGLGRRGMERARDH